MGGLAWSTGPRADEDTLVHPDPSHDSPADVAHELLYRDRAITVRVYATISTAGGNDQRLL